MDGSIHPALLIPSLIGTMFIVLGILYVVGMWADQTWDNYKTLRRYRTNRTQITSLYLIYRMKKAVPYDAVTLQDWIAQEEPLLKWREIGILIPVQEQLMEVLT